MATKAKSLATKKKVKKSPAKKVVKKVATKKSVKKVSVKKAATKKTPAKKTVVKKAVAKKAATKKTPAKKIVAKKAVTKKTPAKKIVAKKAVTKKTPTKKVVAKKATTKKTPAKKARTKTAAVKPIKKTTRRKPTANAVVGVAITRKADLGTQTAVSNSQSRAVDDYMGTKQLAYFKNMLVQWKKTLMEEVDRTVSHMKDDASNFPDPNDRASVEEEFSLELRTRDRERQLISKIDEALQAIQDDEYGYCDACGVEIGLQRLEARPTATQCIDCKTLDEMKEKQIAS